MKARKSGFTLVEILIVVIILGILAAIIIPQFTDASTSAKESSLTSNLQTLRSQIGLYKIQHNDTYPDTTSFDTFVTCLTTVTDVDGNAWVDQATSGTPYGPYMPNVPDNPFIAADVPFFTLIATGVIPAAGDDSTHWIFDELTGAIAPNDSGTCQDDVTLHIEL
jgi:general secretion pathway protein G